MTERAHCRLLYLVGQLRTGGLERQLCYLLQALDQSYFRPEVAVWNFCPTDHFVGTLHSLKVPLHHPPIESGRMARLTWFRNLVKGLTPEVVHSYSFYTNFVAFQATLGSSSVPVGSVRNNFFLDKNEAGFVVSRLSARWPRTQIFNSFRAATNARSSNSWFQPKQVVVVRNGMDLATFPPTPHSTATRPSLLGIGSLKPAKRWDRLLKAAQLLKKRQRHFRIEILGTGPQHEHLEKLAHAFGLSNDVFFQGFHADVSAALAPSLFLVHTAEAEGTPNAIMEAMACGRAVVAMDAGDVVDLVEDGITGFLVPDGDEAVMAQRMETLIDDRELCHRMGQAGRRRAELLFGLDRLVKETLAAYRTAGWKE